MLLTISTACEWKGGRPWHWQSAPLSMLYEINKSKGFKSEVFLTMIANINPVKEQEY